jgi:hypothetical protein
VVQDTDIDEPQCLFETSSDELISLGRFGYTARVRVGQDHSRRVLFERFLDDLSRMN